MASDSDIEAAVTAGTESELDTSIFSDSEMGGGDLSEIDSEIEDELTLVETGSQAESQALATTGTDT